MGRLPRWRNPLRKQSDASSWAEGDVLEEDAPFFRRPDDEPRPLDALDLLMEEIEETALDVYRKNNLPTEHGHYALRPKSKTWLFIADDLTPEERFAIVEVNPTERGWRFGLLHDIGRMSADPEMQAAGDILYKVATLRGLRHSPAKPEDLAAAIKLGIAWKTMQDVHTRHHSPLALRAPDQRKPYRRRKID